MSTSPFLAACRREPHDMVPVWFMRQAGRSLPEYRAIKGTTNILAAIADPALACEITLQPVRRYGVDAAILYSDIVVPVHSVGFGVEIAAGVGPTVDQPFAGAGDLDRLPPFHPAEHTPYVLETVRLLVKELGEQTPVIGFAGAPFTVASYLIEGRPSREYLKTRSLMWSEPALFAALLDRLADYAIASLRGQVEAGASAVQVFDSWAGALSPEDYRTHVLPSLAKILGAVDGVPRIVSGVGTGELLALFVEAGADVVSVDTVTPLDEARRRVGDGVALQGNLDPFAVALAPWDVVEAKAREVLRLNGEHPGHVFNLGHGVRPETDPDVLQRIVDLVHDA